MATTHVSRNPRRLVLCFDGTGNHFQGDPSDTNVVKIFDMLNRHDEDQFQYYQPGIGTFSSGPRKSGLFGSLREKISLKIDEALGTTFEYHVSAGYEFLMKYYSPGDAIYIFGFSRGAYTARFLAEMISEVGLLSQGNEDMIRFAFSSFGNVLDARGKKKKTAKDIEDDRYLKKFKRTFCRRGVSVYFLGLFDCVNSVGQFEVPFRRNSYRYIARAPAKHIRHAASIHERRLKFKPALFEFQHDPTDADIKEVWFAGNHCDVGGGYNHEGSSKHLLSDVPLAWMIDEINALTDQPNGDLAFDKDIVEDSGHLKAGHEWIEDISEGPNSVPVHKLAERGVKLHDNLAFNRGTTWFGTSMWWILETLPLFTRLELEDGQWIPRYWPPNFGATRDLEQDAVIHPSVYHMHNAGIVKKLPKLGGDEAPVLKDPFRLPRLLFAKLCGSE